MEVLPQKDFETTIRGRKEREKEREGEKGGNDGGSERKKWRRGG